MNKRKKGEKNFLVNDNYLTVLGLDEQKSMIDSSL